MARRRSNRDGARLLLSTAPAAAAPRIARALVRARVAACVTVLPGAKSVFRWRGKVDSARESLLLVKTTAGRLAECQRALLRSHPYEVPEVLVFVPRAGNAPYLAWIADSCARKRS